jgi:hypothetical protein
MTLAAGRGDARQRGHTNPAPRSPWSLVVPGCNDHYDSEIGVTIPARSATNTVADVGGLWRVNHPHNLQFDARRQHVEQSTSAAEQQRDLTDLQLIQHPGLERIAVFRIAFERWVVDAQERDLPRQIRESLEELKSVVAGSP